MNKKAIKKIISFILIISIFVIGKEPCKAATVNIRIGNTNTFCNYSDDGSMSFQDSGSSSYFDLPNYNSSTASPWAQYSSNTTQLNVGDVGIIGDYNFADFNALEEIQIRSSYLSKIGTRAFYKCNNVKIIQIVAFDSEYEIQKEAFAYCGNDNLSFIHLLNASKIGEKAFFECDTKNIFFSEKIESIGKQAFANNEKITEIIIPESCTNIGEGAFEGCTDLKSIIILNPDCKIANADSIPDGAVISTKKGGKVEEYADLNDKLFEDLYEGSWGECSWMLDEDTGLLTISGNGSMGEGRPSKFDYIDTEMVKSIVIENGVTSICNGAFEEMINVKRIVIPDSVTDIGDNALKGCYGITDIILPDGIKTIGANAFEQCSIKSILIPEGVTSIGKDAFVNCRGLLRLIVPKSLTTDIGDTKFYCEYDTRTKQYPKKYAFELYGEVYGYKGTDTEAIVNELGYKFIDRDSVFIVSFKMNGFGETPEFQTIEKGETVVKPDDPSEEGVTFGGWYTDAECLTPYDFSAAVNGDTFLYAKWIDPNNTDIPKDPTGNNTANNPSNNPNSDQTNKPTDSGNKTTESIGTGTANVVDKKVNPIIVIVKTKSVKAKKLHKKAQKVKAVTVKYAQGVVKCKLVKKGSSAKLFKKAKISNKGVITIKKVNLKKDTYKLIVNVSAAGNAEYEGKTEAVIVKVKVK